MKRYSNYFLILFWVVSPVILFAQSMTNVEYEKLINEVICDFTDFALKNQQQQPHYTAFKNEVVACDYYSTILFLKSKTNVPKNIREIINLLFYDYFQDSFNEKATNEQQYNNLEGFFEESDVKDFSKIYASSYSSFETDLKNMIKKRLKVGLSKKQAVEEELIQAEFDSISQLPVEEEITEPKATVDIPNNDRPIDENITMKDDKIEIKPFSELGTSLLLFGLLALLIAYAGYWLYQSKKNNSSQSAIVYHKRNLWESIIRQPSKKEVYHNNISELQSLIQNHKTTLATIREDILAMYQKVNQLSAFVDQEEIVEENLKELSEKIDDIEEKQQELLDILEKIETQPITTQAIINETPTLPNAVTINHPPNLFFMPLPNANSSFNYQDWTVQFEKEKSFYRFEKLNNVEAKFIFYDYKNHTATAIAHAETHLKPACIILNIDHKNPTTIVNQNPGIAYKDGDIWKVNKKAVVYYQ